jgi:dihydrofolate synthase/folylpolyglutamate synthase
MRVALGDTQWQGALPSLIGLHQIQNAATAVAACLALGIDISAQMQALENARWSARLQRVHLPDLSDCAWEVYLDGGHNESAGRALAAQCAQWGEDDGEALHLVIGMMQDKDCAAFLEPLLPYAESVTFVDMPHEPKAGKARVWSECVNTGDTAANWQEAINHIAQSEKTGRILLAGSLYLAGDVLQSCEGDILHER